jgi:hypothetical protein
MEVYGGDVDGQAAPAAAAVAAGTEPPHAATAAAGDAALGGLLPDTDGNIPFYFMDAYETSDRPGEHS